jgi:hypothetical protein
MTASSTPIAVALAQTIGAALELTIAGKPYADVIRHLGSMPEHHRDYLMSGERSGTLDPASPLFDEIHFSLDAPGTVPAARVLTMEFISEPGAFTFHHLREAFGEWHRSPPEPHEAAFALAWFVRYDVRSGAPFSLYAEYDEYSAAIDPDRTPGRVYFQARDGRWD